MTSPDVVAIVLAGGASSRFGADKLAAVLDGAPLLHHALRAVAAVADDIVVVLAPDAPAPVLPTELAHRVRFARDAEAHGGPLAGLAAGLVAIDTPAIDTPARDEAPRIALVVGGDMPSLVPAVIRLLIARLAAQEDADAMTLAAPGPAPLPMALRPDPARAAVDAILAAGGRRSLRALLDAMRSATVPASVWRALDAAGDTLRDVDMPGDLRGG